MSKYCGPDNDDHLNYRNKNEVKKWLNDDPIENFLKYLKKSNMKKKIEVIKNKIAIQIKKFLTLPKMISFLKFLHYKKMFMPSKKNYKRITSYS